MPDSKEGLAAFDESLPENPFTNPDTRPKSTLGFRPDPMADKAKEYIKGIGENLDESARRLTTLPRRPDARGRAYGEILAPGFADTAEEGMQAIMLGPIKVEEALGSLALKALPASVLEKRLLERGASKTELEVRGVSDWLKSKGTEPVNPLALMKHLDENPYQLNEIIKGKLPPEYPTPDLLEEALNAANRAGIHEEVNRLNKMGTPTKFEGWQTPGGENYREILLQAPGKGYRVLLDGEEIGSFKTRSGAERYINKEIKSSFDDPEDVRESLQHFEIRTGTGFTGGHWDEPNVVAHMRVNDRTLPSGEKALHVEEWQSDWSNALRSEKDKHTWKFTFKDANNQTQIIRYGSRNEAISDIKQLADSDDIEDAIMALQGQLEEIKSGGQHLLVDNWQDLMARRTLKEAVDGGYDRLTWTTGQQQADRYDLSKHISQVEATNVTGMPGFTTTKWKLRLKDKNRLDEGTGLEELDLSSDDELVRHVGKDLAARIIKENGGKYKGIDLKVGGEWATKLYDESMVNRFNKIGKQYGVKVEDIKLGASEQGRTTKFPDFIKEVNPVIEDLHELAPESDMYHQGLEKISNNMAKSNYAAARNNFDSLLVTHAMTLEENMSAVDELETLISRGEGTKSYTVHSLKITPEMKESIGASKFHPFADLPGPKPKASPVPAAVKKVDLHAEAAALDPANPVRYIGEQFGHPIYQQDDPGVGSFMVQPGETLATAFERARKRYGK